MNSYRINYIDGHDLRYKSFETEAKDKDDALAKLWDQYDCDFDHQIVEVLRVKTPTTNGMRIGSISATDRKSIAPSAEGARNE